MKIVQVNQYDGLGGAARVCWYLFNRYRQQGHRLYLVAGQKSTADPHVIEIPNDRYRNPWSGVWSRAQKLFDLKYHLRILPGIARTLAALGEPRRWFENQKGIEDFHCPAIRHLRQWLPVTPDIIHLHNLHGDYPYFDLRELPRLSRRFPTVITLHDEWTFTGHCAYTLGCERWRSGCGNCPDLSVYPPVNRDATAYNWRRKEAIYRRSRLYVATPCRWLLERAEASVLAGGIIEGKVIHNGIDTEVFYPSERQAARRRLRLPETAWIALFVGHGTRSNRFKDYPTVRDAFLRFSSRVSTNRPKQLILLCVGEAGDPEKVDSAEIRFVDYQTEQTIMADYYRAADVYLHGAHAEISPLVIFEAQACGVPVIATAVGGIPEQIVDGQTGFLVAKGDGEAMAQRLLLLQGDGPLRKKMGAEASGAVLDRFSVEKMAANYMQWYREIVADWADSNHE